MRDNRLRLARRKLRPRLRFRISGRKSKSFLSINKSNFTQRRKGKAKARKGVECLFIFAPYLFVFAPLREIASFYLIEQANEGSTLW
jgi:hypothetical protein